MTGEFFFDSYALVSLLEGRPAYAPYRDRPVVCERYNLYELACFMARSGYPPAKFRTVVRDLRPRVLTPTRAHIVRAAALRAGRRGRRDRRLSYVDAMGYVLAIDHGLTLLTGDRGFAGMPGVELVAA
ncbi:MAG: PIN domain-containing protein [Halobacteriales archaeon]|nr:PIN domain-containing protein [Halobacteriales archaeon]